MAVNTIQTGQIKIPFSLLVIFQDLPRMRRILVTIHAFCDEGGGGVTFGLMGVVAGIAGHVCHLKTPACPEQLNLFAMHIGFARRRSGEIGKVIMRQGITGCEVKDIFLSGLVVTGVADGADIEFLLTGQGPYRGDVFAGFDSGIVLLELYVPGGGAVAAFAVYSIYDRIFVQCFING